MDRLTISESLESNINFSQKIQTYGKPFYYLLYNIDICYIKYLI